VTQQPDDDRTQVLQRAVEAGRRQGCLDDGLSCLLARYYRHLPVEELLERTPDDLVGAALSHRKTAAHRPSGTANVRVFTPTIEQNGWASGHTVVEIVTDDMPFLVDSVTSELARQEREVHLLAHPVMAVRRTATGDLVEVLDVGVTQFAASHGHDGLLESWIHVEIDRLSDSADLKAVATGVRAVLEDVRVAVEDWPKMKQRALDIVAELAAAAPAGLPEAEVSQARDLLEWLATGHFTFLGYREYTLVTQEGHDALQATTGSGLGILRYDQSASSASFEKLSDQARSRAREKKLLILTKANSRATVHRAVYLDYVGIKTFDANGEVVGERRFLGLFASSAYTDGVRTIPVIGAMADEVVRRSGFADESHSGKDLLQILETYPRDELFQMNVDTVYETALSVLHLQERRRTRVFLRTDPYGRFVSVLVYLPRDRYNTAVRQTIARILEETYHAVSLDYTARVSESVLARLHFVVRVDPKKPMPQTTDAELEERIVAATRTWAEDLQQALQSEVGEEEAGRLMRSWQGGFSQAYTEDYSARVAVADLRRLEALIGGGHDEERALDMNLYEPVGALEGRRRLKLYRLSPLSLTQVLPYLADLGVEVVDERPYLMRRGDGRVGYVYDFGLAYPAGVADVDGTREAFCAAFAAAWSGAAESDGFARLVLLAGLTWRQVVVLRTYAKYLRQTGTTFSLDYVERCLRANVAITCDLVALFEARFDPDAFGGAGVEAPERVAAVQQLVAAVRTRLEGVASLDHDRILRSLLGIVLATLRTNGFRVDAKGQPLPYVSIKLDPKQVPDLPAPRPAFEIFVYSPRVEGVHLRFGAVARGGLRWSDRPEDFRTEVLGLVKAQMVKNAVIVPTGAKGGFVAKALPDPAVDREAWLAEGIACYRTFVSGLLDVTDNLGTRLTGADAGGEPVVLPPARVLRHDEDDTYLVVAADKGTATFSDIANALSADYGFWLGDGFASGGSVGYDHKAMGITAKGAWESVKRHFRESGVDVQTQDFSCVGIGDMSGDVFGNGMLLSEHIRLVAAFDHRHIVLDPNPDPAASFAERSRMFALPRSSWADYDAGLLSEGGGIYPRSAKSVPISPQVAARLGLDGGITSLTPNELISAILKAPVDLLWNGGIGTYVKASRQSHAEVGDKGNDAIRVDGDQLRCRVIGEGGNLGFTQLGRVEAAQHGVRVNTDAIDNSAGVDCSDHEVNIKILLDRIVAAGDLTGKQRNHLLAQMTDDVSALVLRDNYEQNVLLGNARKQAGSMVSVHQRFMRYLESRGSLDRAIEFLPDDATLTVREEAGQGLTSPEFSVLVAYAKIALKQDIDACSLPDDTWFEGTLRSYFPPALVERYGDLLATHPLRRQLITTCLVNEMVNRGGSTFAFRCSEETGASAEQVARAYTVCREVFGLRDYVAAVEALDNQVPTESQTVLYLTFRRLLDRAVRWFLQNRPATIDVGAEIARFAPVVAELGPRIPELVLGAEAADIRLQADVLAATGVPTELALRGAALLNVFQLLDITEISAKVELPPAEVAPVYQTLSDRYAIDPLLTRISSLERTDRWQSLARAALRYDLYGALESLTVAVLTSTPAEHDPAARIETWERANGSAVQRAGQTLAEVSRLEKADLASLSVALRTLRSVVRTSS
jgi:glutamate dehydrogenase